MLYDHVSLVMTDICSCLISYRYDKSGNITQSVSTMRKTYSHGDTETMTKTSTAAYNKKGNPVKNSFQSRSVLSGAGGNEFIYSDTTTYKYKNVKVPKKYWHLYDN